MSYDSSTIEKETPDLPAWEDLPAPSRGGIDVMGIVLPALVIALLFGLWVVIVNVANVPSIIFPSLQATLISLVTTEPQLIENLGVTVNEAIRGFILGNVIAIVVATIFVHSRNAERTFFPVAILIQTIPIVIYVPFLQIFFGTGQESKVIVSILISFFPTLVNMTKGLRAVDPNIRDLMRLLNASPWQIYWKLRWPSSLPFLFASLKITSTLCIIGAIVGEFFGSQAGIGYLLQLFVFQEDKADLMAAVLLASVTSIIFFTAMVLLERYLLPWVVD